MKLCCSGIIKLCLIATIIATIFTTCFLLSCPNLAFAGVTSKYHSQSLDASIISTSSKNLNLKSECNLNCECNNMIYDPICGSDGIMYYSPCYAGCKNEMNTDSSKIYFNCDCINSQNNSNYDAINTMCTSSCTYLPYFVTLCFILMLTTFLATMPALSATLR